MSDIEWAEPPPRARPGPRTSWVKEAVKKLQRRPGEWAAVKRGARSAAAAQVWKNHGCDTVTRREDDGYTIYARWPAS